MGYEETLDWIYVMRRIEPKRDLSTVRHLLGLLGDPQDSFRSIQVTGTNGKGSTTAMISSILEAGGIRVGMFTSPHLSSFTERIVVNGVRISKDDVIRMAESMKPLIDQMAEPGAGTPGFFDIVTSMAFKHFAEQDVELAVLEAGIGGRLDATNVVHSIVSVITNVGLEHTNILGKTILDIAREKAGIIKEGGILITATDDDEVYSLFLEVCDRVGSKIFRVGADIRFAKIESSQEGQSFRLDGLMRNYEKLFIPLIGDHQLKNASAAVGVVEALGYHGIDVPEEAIQAGLAKVRWPGRLEIVERNPLVVLDCAKDAYAARALKEVLLRDFDYERLIAVVSISSDKDIPSMIEQLAQVVDLFVITAHGVMGRAAKPSVIAEEVKKHSKPFEIVDNVRDAIQRAMRLAHEGDLICITGSVFLVGEARELLIPTSR